MMSRSYRRYLAADFCSEVEATLSAPRESRDASRRLTFGVRQGGGSSNFYNVARRHSALNCLTPIEFEDLHSTHIQRAALS